MLVLTRKTGERITCEVQPSDKVTTIELVLVKIELGQIRLGFEADIDQVNIRRNEVADEPYFPVIEHRHDDDCDVDTSPHAAPLKQLGTAIRDARLAGIDKRKNHHHED